VHGLHRQPACGRGLGAHKRADRRDICRALREKHIAPPATPYFSSWVKISVKVDYACRVLIEMARLHGTGQLAQIDHLAKIEAVPSNFLAQILSELRNAGLITSKRGIQGGYMLARPPDQISMYDIVKTIDGELLEFSGNHAGRSGRKLKQIWGEIRAALDEKARAYTLDALAAKDVVDMYHI